MAARCHGRCDDGRDGRPDGRERGGRARALFARVLAWLLPGSRSAAVASRRPALGRLDRLDDRMLRDIGLRRTEDRIEPFDP